ncbi:hypothetical protein JKP88DRAFT_178481, partial [Tribonema minus]
VYVCGAPGTGKTCTLQRLEHEVRTWLAGGSGSSAAASAAAAAARPTFINVDAVFQTSPMQVFQRVLDKIPKTVQHSLRGKRSGGGDARAQLEAMLAPPDDGGASSSSAGGTTKTMLVLTIDEVNYLRGRGDPVLQALFGWACAPNSRLILIGVANGINFTKKADLGVPSDAVKTLVFPTYTAAQLKEIVAVRAGSVFQPRAAAVCVKRVAARSGDAREMLQLAQSAALAVRKRVQAALASGRSLDDDGGSSSGVGTQVSSNVAATVGMVTTRDISAADAAFNGASNRSTIGELPPAHKLLLCVIAVLRAECCGKPPEVMAIKERFAYAMDDAGFGTYQQYFNSALQTLVDYGHVDVKGGGTNRFHWHQKPRLVKLNVSVDDLRAVLTAGVYKKVLRHAGGGGGGGAWR